MSGLLPLTPRKALLVGKGLTWADSADDSAANSALWTREAMPSGEYSDDHVGRFSERISDLNGI